MDIMYYIGLDVHKKTIRYRVKDASWQVHQQSKIAARRHELYGFVWLDEDFSVATGSSHVGNDFHGVEAVIRLTLTTDKTGLQELLQV